MFIRIRDLAITTAAVVVGMAGAFLPAPAFGQSGSAPAKSSDIPRLPNGKPDFNGIWDHPRASDITKNGNACGSGTPGCKQEGSGELSYTEWGLSQWKAASKFDYSAFCQPWGYTRATQTEYPVEFVQTPDRFVIMWESNNVFHVVPTDGRAHRKDIDQTWMGDSVGRYEGDTLVIDTTNFNGKTWIDTAEHPSSDQLHIVERIHFIDHDHLAYEVTWEDPKTYTKPIKNNRVFARMKPGAEIMEWWCMENNRDMLQGHLVGSAPPPK